MAVNRNLRNARQLQAFEDFMKRIISGEIRL